jgi:hypothetical protein
MSKNITIELSEEQYKNLLKLVYLGEWVSQSYAEEPSEEILDTVENIYKLSKDTDAENSVEYDKEIGRHFPTAEFEEEMLDYIDDYDDNVFWDELVDRMSEKELLDKFGEEKVEKMSFEDRIEEESSFIEKYENEFAENGIERLKISQ